MISKYKVWSMVDFDDNKILLPSDIISLCGIVLQKGQSESSCIMHLLSIGAIPQPRDSMIVSWLLGDIRELFNQ